MARTTPKTPKPAAVASPSSKPEPGRRLDKGDKSLTLADGKTKANVDAMRRAAKQLGVEIPKARGAKPDLELLGGLRIEGAKRLAGLPVDDHVKCVVCDEIATDDTTFCPYCGDEGGDSPEAAAATAAVVSEIEDEIEAADEVEAGDEGGQDEPGDDAAEENEADETEDSDDDDEEDDAGDDADEADEEGGDSDDAEKPPSEGLVIAATSSKVTPTSTAALAKE